MIDNKLRVVQVSLDSYSRLKELRHDILSHFFDGPSNGLSVGKPKSNGLLIKEKTKKGRGWLRMEKIETDWNNDLEKLSYFFRMHKR